jgi:hypothetical protein
MGSKPDYVIEIFQLINASSRIQPLTEMSTRNLLVIKALPVLKTDNLSAICELIV